MEEIIEQYNAAKKWRMEMLFAMTVTLALAVIIVIVGIIIKDLLAMFLVLGGVIGILGVIIFVVANVTFKKADSMVRQYLAANGKTEEEINSVLGTKSK